MRIPYRGIVYNRFSLCIRVYFSIYENKIDDRSTGTGYTTRYGVHDRLSSCLFDLGSDIEAAILIPGPIPIPTTGMGLSNSTNISLKLSEYNLLFVIYRDRDRDSRNTFS